MALLYRNIIISTARAVDKVVIDVEGNESWERLKIHAVPLIRYMGKGTEGLQKMREEIQVENEGVAIPAQVRWLTNPRTIKERRRNGEITASSVVFVVKGSKVAQGLIKRDIKAAGVWYCVEQYTNAGPNSRCELSCGWGHIESKCSSQPTCGSCSGSHRTSNHECNVVGCTAKPGSLCGHTQEKRLNCKGNHIACSSRRVKKTEAANAAQESGSMGASGRTAVSAAKEMATGTNRVVLGDRLKAAAEGGGS
jgi:hypothetical protein